MQDPSAQIIGTKKMNKEVDNPSEERKNRLPRAAALRGLINNTERMEQEKHTSKVSGLWKVQLAN